MAYQLRVMVGLLVACSLVSGPEVFAQGLEKLTPEKILALQGNVLKQEVKFPVHLSDGEEFLMAGFFYFHVEHVSACLSLTEPQQVGPCLFELNVGDKPVQTLVHGMTYNHRYWDVERINGRLYSYARYMAENDFVVLGLDLLGSGQSDVPGGDRLTLDESSLTIAQVLESLKSGQNPMHHAFGKVILTGHSLGSILSVATLGTFPHVADALIVTAWAFAPHVVLSPDLIEAIFQNPYVRIPSQIREDLFYFLPKADPDVVEFDQRYLADQTPRGIFAQGLPLLEAMARGTADDVKFIKAFSGSNRIRVPVFIQLGEFDVIAPARLAGQEASFYPNARTVQVHTLPNIGHAFNLHEKNRKGWKQVKRWLESLPD
ncbi:MAG: alpha/beta hydrolase [Nitrospirales bacterium]|nr:alpha/beta fold hydrolase [Nitrospira sp.]MDR4500053.1 alpha/beta hydrolase [Nitrospirales bacterium]